MRVEQPAGEHPAVSLMRTGLLACSPVVPSVAISLGILELYYRIRRHAPRLGVQPFVRALCDKYLVRKGFCGLYLLLTFSSVITGLTCAISSPPPSTHILLSNGRSSAEWTARSGATLRTGARSTRAHVATTRYVAPPCPVLIPANQVLLA